MQSVCCYHRQYIEYGSVFGSLIKHIVQLAKKSDAEASHAFAVEYC